MIEAYKKHLEETLAHYTRLLTNPTPEEKKQLQGLLPLAKANLTVATAACEMAMSGNLITKK